MSEQLTPMPSTAPDELMLVITRHFEAPIQTVWSALTDLNQAPAWWGPHGFHVPRETIEADFEVGGRYRACMVQEETGQRLWWSGIHTRIEPPTTFEYTYAWDNEDGTRGYETEVAIKLEEEAGGTRMTFTPVSYTHLDVYKRQATAAAGARPLTGWQPT
ncbi:SRPBCC domain-containing protein [Arthrobacter sp. KBS0703]|uniref:SRPBCC family protein n=1 Tax=Arthrobacter sp. KBS0703 TaxID=1955698 RepID=UPI0011849539|nr:SRPBCC domain-containing protein [Arthrobacter sp. KBS0703]TSE17778.1 SRPBCC domain-containing protein [Arthrobacter sp. KBS0703]